MKSRSDSQLLGDLEVDFFFNSSCFQQKLYQFLNTGKYQSTMYEIILKKNPINAEFVIKVSNG